MLRKFPSIHVITGFFMYGFNALFMYLFFSSFYSLLTNNYVLKPTDIFNIDTFKLLSRGYENRGGKGGSVFNFESANRYEFRISGSVYYSLIDRQFLADTLMYSQTEFIAYADKETQERYIKEKEPFAIDLLQLKIGDRYCVNLDERNKREHSRLISMCFIMPFFSFFIFIVNYFDYRKQDISKKLQVE